MGLHKWDYPVCYKVAHTKGGNNLGSQWGAMFQGYFDKEVNNLGKGLERVLVAWGY